MRRMSIGAVISAVAMILCHVATFYLGIEATRYDNDPLGVILAGLSIVWMGISFLLTYETYALVSGKTPPITTYARAGIKKYFTVALVIGLTLASAILWLYGHFFLGWV
jgi:hypothetical protein